MARKFAPPTQVLTCRAQGENRDICNQLAFSAKSLFDEQNLDDDQPQIKSSRMLATSKQKGNVLMVDGFTATAADTEANHEAYPQNRAQKEGLGFPII